MDKRQNQKARRSALEDPALMGAAMKAIYDSSEVSVRRGDETKVVNHLYNEERTSHLIQNLPKGLPSSPSSRPVNQPPTRQIQRQAHPNPILQDHPSDIRFPQNQVEHTRDSGLSNVSNEYSSTSYKTYSSKSEILYWISLVTIFAGIAYWISI